MSNEKNGTGINWSKVRFVVESGEPNVEATLAAIALEMKEHLSSNVVDTAAIAEAIDGVFARMGEAENKLVEIETLALKALGSMTDVEDESKMLKAIKNYIRSESEKFVASNGTEGKLWCRVGRRGGCRLATPSTIESFRALQARKQGAVAI